MIRILYRFFALNRELCAKIEPYLPQAKVDIVDLYDTIVVQYMNMKVNQTVVDIGGGRRCPFAKYRDPSQKANIIAVDISEEELEYNTDADETKVANVSQRLPFSAEEVDVIVSRMVLEHLEKLEGFVADAERTLKKGGHFIHLFPSKFAPFTLINQALPNVLAKKVLHFFSPRGAGTGFPSFYDTCFYTGICKLLKEYDFEIVEMHLSYYQSRYFDFFVPLYLISALYEMLIRTLEVKDLCAYVLIVARKPDDTSPQ